MIVFFTGYFLRRDRFQIMAGILKSCVYNGLSISQLLAFQNLSYKILKPSLDHLSSSKLVEYEIDKRRKFVRTTAQGVQALRAYETAIALMDGRPSLHSTQETIKPSTTARSRFKEENRRALT
jgi:predicted transcriptional regulator